MARKKILFLPSWYPNRTGPALGIFVQRHAEAAAIYNDISVLCAFPDPSLEEEFEIVETFPGNIHTVIVYYRKVQSSIPLASQLKKLSRRIKAYRIGFEAIKKRAKPQALHCHVAMPAGIFALELHRRHNLPYVLTEHWTGYLPADGRYKGLHMKYFTRKIVRYAGRILPVSHDLEKAMKAHGLDGKYTVVPNVVDTKLFHPSNDNTNSKKRLIHVSALDDAQKNISGLLRTAKKVSAKYPRFELLIVGDGEDRKKLEQLAKDIGIMNTHIRFTGPKHSHELAAIMRSADGFVMFSNYENQPCVLIESLASGVPVIAPRVGGIPEFVTGETGILIEPGNEDQLAEAMLALLREEKKFDRNALGKYAAERFSYEQAGRQLDDIYTEITGNA